MNCFIRHQNILINRDIANAEGRGSEAAKTRSILLIGAFFAAMKMRPSVKRAANCSTCLGVWFTWLSPFALFLFVLLSQYSLCAKESRACLYGLIFCDTISEDIRKMTAADAERIQATFSTIATLTNMRAKISIINADASSPIRLQQWILSIHPQKNDVVFCYFTCHGFRTPEQQTPWPRLFFPHQNTSVDGASILNDVRRRTPRLTIIIFECCNSVVHYKSKGVVGALPPPSLCATGTQELFNNQSGVVIVCTASPGERAFGIPGGFNFPIGGIFTTCFLSSLSEESSASHPQWETLMEKASLYCQYYTKNMAQASQTPYSVISTRKACKN